jgi:hypothetical protein
VFVSARFHDAGGAASPLINATTTTAAETAAAVALAAAANTGTIAVSAVADADTGADAFGVEGKSDFNADAGNQSITNKDNSNNNSIHRHHRNAGDVFRMALKKRNGDDHGDDNSAGRIDSTRISANRRSGNRTHVIEKENKQKIYQQQEEGGVDGEVSSFRFCRILFFSFFS